MTHPRRALVTGVTGYIGSRLVPRLLEEGWQVRALTRDDAKVADRWWRDQVEVVEGDAGSAETLATALEGVDVAYYFLHSMDGEGDFVERDRALARTFGRAADEAGVGRIVYLSGLHPDHEPLSDHLASRVEVGDLLMSSGAPTAVLQAAVIIGSGSASFEMLRHLTTRLPVMVTPKWLDNRIQPIAVRDVLHYLVRAADLPPEVNRTFDIGGPDVLTYREMIQRFASIAGLMSRRIVTVPVLTPFPRQPVGRVRHPGADRCRQAPRRQPAARGGLRRARPRRPRRAAARRPAVLRPGRGRRHCRRPREPSSGTGHGRPCARHERRPGVGRRSPEWRVVNRDAR